MPEKMSKKTAPPWTAKGMLIHDEKSSSYKPLLVSHVDETKDFTKTPVTINLFGTFDVSVEVID
jgi:hypothetical protein